MYGLEDQVRIVNPSSGRYHQEGEVVKVLPDRGVGETFILRFSDGRELGFGINEIQGVEQEKSKK